MLTSLAVAVHPAPVFGVFNASIPNVICVAGVALDSPIVFTHLVDFRVVFSCLLLIVRVSISSAPLSCLRSRLPSFPSRLRSILMSSRFALLPFYKAGSVPNCVLLHNIVFRQDLQTFAKLPGHQRTYENLYICR